MRKKRHIGQKIAFASAIFSALMILPTLAAFFWAWQTRGMADTWTPSILTTVVFFALCAGVLYAISRPQPILPLEVTEAEKSAVNG